jgi:hypothetical protein
MGAGFLLQNTAASTSPGFKETVLTMRGLNGFRTLQKPALNLFMNHPE